MLKIRNEEDMILLFFGVVFMVVGFCAIMNRGMLDISYLCVMFIYFVKFLIVKIQNR